MKNITGTVTERRFRDVDVVAMMRAIDHFGGGKLRPLVLRDAGDTSAELA